MTEATPPTQSSIPSPTQTNDPAPEPVGPPETYTFTPPEGQTYDEATLTAATPLFKELGLTQAAADKLVAFYNTKMKDVADLGLKAITAQGEKWTAEVKADPKIGPRLEQIKTDIGRAFDAVGLEPELRAAFAKDMDLSMVGNSPAFIKVFDRLVQRVVEGKPVSGGGPSPLGQSPTGQVKRPSAASAMYPNLPS